MARVVISHFSGIYHLGEWRSSVFYEGLIEALIAEGNDVLQLISSDFLPRPWNGSNKPFLPEFKQQALEAIKTFNPDLVIAFNNSTIEDIEKTVDCPIVLWDADSFTFFNNKDEIKANTGRYTYFAFSNFGVQDYRNMLGLSADKVHRVSAATGIKAESRKKKYNISFIGTYFSWPWQLRDLYQISPKSFFELLDQAEKLDDDALNHLLKSESYQSLGITSGHVRHCAAGQERMQVIAAIAPLGLGLFGDAGWQNIASLSLSAARSYHHERVFTQSHNAAIYNRSELAISIAHSQNVSGYPWRVKDIMASNAVLVSDRKPDLISDFGQQVPLQLFDNPSEAYHLCKKLLAEPALRADVVAASQAAIALGHTWHQRLSEISSIVSVPMIGLGQPGHYQRFRLQLPDRVIRLQKLLDKMEKIKSKALGWLPKKGPPRPRIRIRQRIYQNLIKGRIPAAASYALLSYNNSNSAKEIPEYKANDA